MNFEQVQSQIDRKQALETPHSEACFLINRIQSAGFQAYVVGGAVRDLLIGKTPKDFDIATSAKPEEVKALFANNPQIRSIDYIDATQAFPVVLAKFNDGSEIEIATFRRDVDATGRRNVTIEPGTLEDDVHRRDFTINALVLDPLSGEITDLIGGKSDIESRIIRFVGDPRERIKEDPLRILRAVRFKNRLGFKYDSQTEIAITEAVKNGALDQLKGERVGKELTQILLHSSRLDAILDLDRFGILEHPNFLPEFTAGKGIEQPHEFHAEGDVWTHQLEVLKQLTKSSEPPSTNLLWAIILHDIGKPSTQSFEDRIRFNDHDDVGAKLAEEILRERFCFGRQNGNEREVNREHVIWMVENHMRIASLPQMRKSKQIEIFNHPAFRDLLRLHQVDCLGTWNCDPQTGTVSNDHSEHLRTIIALAQEHFAQSPVDQKPHLKRDLGIDGEWIMANFKLSPGPLVGKILKTIETAFLDGERSIERLIEAATLHILSQ